MLILLVASGPQKGQVFELDEDRPRELGRHCDDVPIKDSRMSRKHARLTPRDGKWFILDLQSTNGTFVNGRPIVGETELQNGDRVQVGSTYFVVTRLPSHLQGQATPDAAAAAAADKPLDEDDILETLAMGDDDDDVEVIAPPPPEVSPPKAAPVEAEHAHELQSVGFEAVEAVDEDDTPIELPPPTPPTDASTVVLTPEAQESQEQQAEEAPGVQSVAFETAEPAEDDDAPVDLTPTAPVEGQTVEYLPAKPTLANLDGNIVAIMRLSDLPEPVREQFMSGKLFKQRRVWPWALAMTVLVLAAFAGSAWFVHEAQQRLETRDAELRAQFAAITPPDNTAQQEQLERLDQQLTALSAARQQENARLLEQFRAELASQPRPKEDPALKELLSRVEALAAKPEVDPEQLAQQAKQQEETQAALQRLLDELQKQREEIEALRAQRAAEAAVEDQPAPAPAPAADHIAETNETDEAAEPPAPEPAAAAPEPEPMVAMTMPEPAAATSEPQPEPAVATPAPVPMVPMTMPDAAPTDAPVAVTADAPPPAPAAAPDPQAASIVFLVDVSGSMIDALPIVLDELRQQVEGLDEGTQFAVIFFHAGQAIPAAPTGLGPATAERKAALARWMSSSDGQAALTPRGSSNPVEALKLAMSYQPQRIRVLSERITGPRRGEVSADALRDLLKQLNPDKRTRIDVVQFFNFDDQGTLKSIAEAYGGSHRLIDSATFNPAPPAPGAAEEPIDLFEALQ